MSAEVNIPQLRFKEFSGEWEEKKLQEITKINQGLQIAISERFTEEVEDSYFYITNEFLKENSEKKYFIKNPSESVLCDMNDVLMTRTGNTGQVVTNVKGAFHNNFFKIKYSDDIDKDFLVYFLRSVKTQTNIMKLAGTSTIPDLNHGDFYRLKINLPTKPEQEKIASFLSSVDTKIEQLTKKKTLLAQYKKGVMHKIFSQEIRFEDDGGSKYPEWIEKKLGDFKDLIHGDGDWILSKDITDNGQYKIVQLGNIDLGKYVDKPLKTISKNKFHELNGTPIRKGDLLINRMVDGNINCCIFEQDKDFITSVDVCWIRENKYFINYFLMSLMLVTKNQNKLLSLSSGSGRVRISKKNLFEKFNFMLPCLEEQIKIANFLLSLDSKIEQAQKQLDSTKEFKKALLQQMFV